MEWEDTENRAFNFIGYLGDLWKQRTIQGKIPIVVGAHSKFAGLLPELQGEHGVTAPRNVLLHVDLRLVLAQLCKPLPTNAPQIHLGHNNAMEHPNINL